MEALSELGLDASADERAVKRAYARRLKTVRPDDDPQGFQQLHETYTAALAYVRWRAERPDEAEPDDEGQPHAPERDEPGDEDASPSGSAPGEASVVIADATLSALFREETPERFQFNLDAFLKDLFERAAGHGGAAFRDWLAREASFWPFGVKPLIVSDVLAHMTEEERYVSPAQLQAIVDVFELDDVLAGFDPIALGLLRRRMERNERALKISALLRPDERRELVRHMSWTGRGGHSAPVTRAVVAVLIGRHALRWARVLRFVPFVTRTVTDFLHHLDDGRYDALTPAIDQATLEFWVDAEVRRQGGSKLRYALVIFAALVAFSYLVSEDKAGRPQGGLPTENERTILDQIQEGDARLDAEKYAEAIAFYDRALAGPQPNRSGYSEQAFSTAYYNKGFALEKLGRPDEARRTYEALDRTFADSPYNYVRILAAAGLVNAAEMRYAAGDYTEANVLDAKVVDRYAGSTNDDLNVQVAKALLGRANSWRSLGRKDDALKACDEVLRRFGASTFDRIKAVVAETRALRRLLE